MNDRPETVCSTRFRNPPEKCSEWLTLMRNGSIEAEIYDRSQFAHGCFGSDIAYILTLDFKAVQQLMEHVRPEDDQRNWSGVSQLDLYYVSQKFDCYHEFKGFCDFNEIPYSLVFEGNA